MRPTMILTALAGLAVIGGAPAGARSEHGDPPSVLFDDEGYRSGRYRSPVHADPHPAAQLDLAASLALEPGTDALFIDVMPVEGGKRDPATGRWTLSQQHLTIPGALWYPETGRASIDSALWAALEDRVLVTRRAAPDRPVVIFCRIDCWMSWNAARRLAARGIDNVWWLAEGTDGWHDQGRPLVVATPVETPAARQQPQRQEN